MLAKNSADNSFFVAVDDGAFAAWHLPVSTSWKWRNLYYGGKVIYLEAGTHTLTIKQRERGTRINRVLISGDTKYVPD